MALQDDRENEYCIKCNKIYTNLCFKWCKPCQIKDLKGNFINWTSGNEKIDNFNQEMQLKIDKYDDIVFEWIPYIQFSDIKETDKDNISTVYLVKWKGPLYWNEYDKKYVRNTYKEVSLKYSH